MLRGRAPDGALGKSAIMRLAEVDGKALLRRHGLAVPRERAAWRRRKSAQRDSRLARIPVKGASPRRRPRQARLGAAFRQGSRFARRAAADPGEPRRRRHAASARRGGADRARDFHGGPHRRHAAGARASDRAARRRECRAIGQARAHCGCGGNDCRKRFFRRSPSFFRASLAARLSRYARGCPTSPARRTWSFWRSIRWR